MKIILPPKVKYIIDKIYEKGYEAYIVGGCVRDSIIGLHPSDYDITTSANPEMIKEIFKDNKCIDTGIDHGTVSIVIDNEIFEVTTFRVEGEYKDHRRPENVEFTRNLEEDLKRRDFTINAMAYNEQEGLVDLFNGKLDIRNKIIKTVGSPDERFNEDGLRMVRAIRFSSKLNFQIEENTFKAIYNNAPIISNISLERITDEISKILLSDHAEKIIYLFRSKLLYYLKICNELDNKKINDLENNLFMLNKIEKDLIKRLATLDYIITKYNIDCNSISNSLIFSKKIQKEVDLISSLIQNTNLYDLDKIKIKLILNEFGLDIFKTYLEISNVIFNDKNEIIIKLTNILEEIVENNECYTIKELNINGRDIMDLGYKNKEIGEILNYLLHEVIKNPDINKKNDLIKKITLM